MIGDIASLIKNVPLFSQLDESNIEGIASVASMRFYEKNRSIFNEGEDGNILFILKSGVVKIFVTNEDGRKTIIKVLNKNDFFGEMSLLDGGYRSATIVAAEDCMAVLIFRDDLISIFRRYPSIILNMLSSLSVRLRKTNDKIADLTFLDASGKVARVLIDFIPSLGKHDNNSGQIIIDLPFSRQEIAEMAGVSRETLTRVLNKFQEKSYIKVDGKRIEIVDLKGLDYKPCF